MFLFINPENGWGMISSKTLITFYQTIQCYTPEIRVMQVDIIFSSLLLLPVSCYFQPRVTFSLMLLPQISVHIFFSATCHKYSQTEPLVAIGVQYKDINRRNQNVVDW